MNNETALAVVQKAKDDGALVFTNMENFEAKTELYRTEVTILSSHESDFHGINGKFMPTRATTDRIGEACGVQFIQAACRVTAETRDDPLCGKHTVYCAQAQGKVRMPDGSWRTSTVDEYEFDPVLRAMLDKNVTELNETTKKTIGRTIMDYTKVGRQRAATGARLRVIRQLTGMPAAFEKADVLKPMVFTRIVQNTSYILSTPEGRAMATAQALGVDMSTLFGGRKLLDSTTVQPEGNPPPDEHPPPDTPPKHNPADLAAQAAAADEPEFPDEPTGPGTAPEATEFQRLTNNLLEFLDGYKNELDVVTKTGRNPYKLAEAELAHPAATEETRRSMIKRLMAFLKAKGINV